MILVTVGTQLPFDRLIRSVDEWAGRHHRTDVFAQVGRTRWQPKHISWTQFLGSDAFRKQFDAARLVITHAGMGTVIKAREMGKPIIVMPRRADAGEHRNDHQLATAKRLRDLSNIHVSLDQDQLIKQLENIDAIQAPPAIEDHAAERLINTLRNFIEERPADFRRTA